MRNRPSLSLVVVSIIVIFFSLAIWTEQGQGGPRVAQAWEYKTLVFVTSGLRRGLFEDGAQLAGSATPISRAAELGAQGWELVSVTSTASGGPTDTFVYWFKRPK